MIPDYSTCLYVATELIIQLIRYSTFDVLPTFNSSQERILPMMQTIGTVVRVLRVR